VLVGLCLLLQGDNIDDEQHAHLYTCRLMIDQLVNDEWFAVEMNPSTPFDLGDPSRARGVLSDVRSVYLVIRHFNVRAPMRPGRSPEAIFARVVYVLFPLRTQKWEAR